MIAKVKRLALPFTVRINERTYLQTMINNDKIIIDDSCQKSLIMKNYLQQQQ